MIVNKVTLSLLLVYFSIAWDGIAGEEPGPLHPNFAYGTYNPITLMCASKSSPEYIETSFTHNTQKVETNFLKKLTDSKPKKFIVYFEGMDVSPKLYKDVAMGVNSVQYYQRSFEWIKHDPDVAVCYFLYHNFETESRLSDALELYYAKPTDGRSKFVVRLAYQLIKIVLPKEEIASKLRLVGYRLGSNIPRELRKLLIEEPEIQPPLTYVWDVSRDWATTRELTTDDDHRVMVVHCEKPGSLDKGSSRLKGTANAYIINFPDIDKATHVPALLFGMASTGRFRICLAPGKKGPGYVIELLPGVVKRCEAHELEYGMAWEGSPAGEYSLDWTVHKLLQDKISEIPPPRDENDIWGEKKKIQIPSDKKVQKMLKKYLENSKEEQSEMIRSLDDEFKYETTDPVTLMCAVNSSGPFIEASFTNNKVLFPPSIFLKIRAMNPNKFVVYFDGMAIPPKLYRNETHQYFERAHKWIENDPEVVVCYFLYNYIEKPSNHFNFLLQIYEMPQSGRFEFVVRLGYKLIQNVLPKSEISKKLRLIGFSMGGHMVGALGRLLKDLNGVEVLFAYVWDIAKAWPALETRQLLVAGDARHTMVTHCAITLKECGAPRISGTVDIFIINFPDVDKRHHVPAWLHGLTSMGKYLICCSPGKKGPGRAFNNASGVKNKCSETELVYGVAWTGAPTGVFSLDWNELTSLHDLKDKIPGRSYEPKK